MKYTFRHGMTSRDENNYLLLTIPTPDWDDVVQRYFAAPLSKNQGIELGVRDNDLWITWASLIIVGEAE